MNRVLVVILGGFAVGLVACSDGARISAAEKEIHRLSAQVFLIQAQLEVNETVKRTDSVAFLTPGTSGYSVVQSDVGPMTVSLEDIQPYASGSRVMLKFGNLTSATLNGVKVTLGWGSVDSKGAPVNSSEHSREVTFVEPFRPGAWTNVSVVLDGVPPGTLGFVRVKDVGHRGLSMMM